MVLESFFHGQLQEAYRKSGKPRWYFGFIVFGYTLIPVWNLLGTLEALDAVIDFFWEEHKKKKKRTEYQKRYSKEVREILVKPNKYYRIHEL
jgi:tryptophan-rich sensory protein